MKAMFPHSKASSVYIDPGMGLRDFFAAIAMHALLSKKLEAEASSIDSWESVARVAYMQADHMMYAGGYGE